MGIFINATPVKLAWNARGIIKKTFSHTPASAFPLKIFLWL